MPPFVQLKKFAAYYGTSLFIAVFTRALHWCLSWSRSIESTLAHPSSRFNLILFTHLCVGLPNGLFPSGFPTNNLHLVFSTYSYYIPCPSHPPWLHYYNCTWRGAQVTELLVKQLSPPSSHSIPFRSNCSPQHTVPKHPQSPFLP
jgi:hypothetical protein